MLKRLTKKSFAADGKLNDWAGITSFRIFKSDGSGYIVINTIITNDADVSGVRERIMTYSPNNEEQSYLDVSRWAYTWIGDKCVVGVKDEKNIVQPYHRFQKYTYFSSGVYFYKIESGSFVKFSKMMLLK